MPSAVALLLLLFLHALAAKEITITVLATTDMHGNLLPYDYLSGKPAERGLGRLATHIRAERARNPNTILIDCGDTIQGTPLEGLYQQWIASGKLPPKLSGTVSLPGRDPMMTAMSELKYDAMVLGNHEFNYGLANLDRARSDASFPWLSANTVAAPGSGRKPFAPYSLITTGGVRVAVVGITTPAIPQWEKPENYRGYSFGDGVKAAAAAVQELQSKHRPDLVIVAAHAGLGRDLKTGAPLPGAQPGENMIYDVARQISGIDAVVFGHTHSAVKEAFIGEVLVAQPKNWAISLAALDFVFETAPKLKLIRKSSRLLEAASAATDPAVARIAEPYHLLTERYLNSAVAQASAPLAAARCRVEDTALIDAVHAVQLHYAKADISLTACFNPSAAVAAGPVTVRSLAALYLYDNELYAIEGTGKMFREALENAARYFNTCPDASCGTGTLINRNVIGYNFDMAQGVAYEIDLTAPEGSRIKNLRFRGKALADDQPLRIAVNNYRAAGSAGYGMLKDAKIVWRSYTGIRELLIEYYSSQGKLPPRPDNNWRVMPEAARARLNPEITATDK